MSPAIDWISSTTLTIKKRSIKNRQLQCLFKLTPYQLLSFLSLIITAVSLCFRASVQNLIDLKHLAGSLYLYVYFLLFVFCFLDSLSNGVRNKHLHSRQLQIISASGGQSWSVVAENKRKVVEHICLLKAKEGLSEEKEECMLDFLYTSQYQMRGIIAISLGRISDQNIENYTHAVFMRFQRKEDLAKFYENPFYVGVLENHVMPHCHVWANMDPLMWITNLKLKMIFSLYFGKERSSTTAWSLCF